jgi:signal transduction histidine kinase
MDCNAQEPIVWNDNLSTGIDVIDAQHRHLAELLNRAVVLAGENDSAARAEMTALLSEMSVGLIGHLRYEAAVIPIRQVDDRMKASADELTRAHEQLVKAQVALAEGEKELEQARGQLLQSEKMAAVGQLAAGVAHEINNPVGFVSSNLGSLGAYVTRLFEVIAAYERLEAVLPDDAPGRVAVAEVRKAVEFDYLKDDIPDLLKESVDGLGRVKRIVEDLKNFSRLGGAEFKESDLNAELESTLNVVWNEIKYKAHVTKALADVPPVRCIASQINQVFMNLLVNASHAIEVSGDIFLRSGVDGDMVWIEVEDTGKGMAAEVQKSIFEPFFTTKPVGKGTGLGLSISLDIIKRHGGHVSVTSTPGIGTVFRVVLPVAGPEEPSDEIAV